MTRILRPIKLIYFLPFVFVAFFLLIFLLMRGDGGADGTPPIVGKVAPALITVALGGEGAKGGEISPIDDAVLTAEGVKIVNFWASWCVPCRIEHPQLMALQSEGVKIYGISYLDRPKRARAYLEKYGNPYAGAGDDPARKTALEWGVRGVPESYIVDGRGRVIFGFYGPITPVILEKKIRPILSQAQSGR